VAEAFKFGLFGLHRGFSADPATMARQARSAEEAGFESIWIGDHVALPAGDPLDARNPALQGRLEVLVALSFIAAVTRHVRLAAGVIVLPQRHPVLLAKQLSSIDVLSQGRLIVGLGIGYVEPELSAFGVSLADRAARAEEHLAAMLALWDEPTPRVEGRHVSFADVLQRPRPVQRPHPPLVIGGNSDAALRRAALTGNGWYGWDLEVEEAARAVAQLRVAAERYGRPANLGQIEVTITPNRHVDLDTARRFADIGVDRLVLQPREDRESTMDELIDFVGGSLAGRV
jgi:probable F420-dependent oxidoreductase